MVCREDFEAYRSIDNDNRAGAVDIYLIGIGDEFLVTRRFDTVAFVKGNTGRLERCTDSLLLRNKAVFNTLIVDRNKPICIIGCLGHHFQADTCCYYQDSRCYATSYHYYLSYTSSSYERCTKRVRPRSQRLIFYKICAII